MEMLGGIPFDLPFEVVIFYSCPISGTIYLFKIIAKKLLVNSRINIAILLLIFITW